MPLVRRAGGIAHRAIIGLTRRPLEPGSGVPFDLFLRGQARLARVDGIRRSVFGDELALLDRFLAACGITDPVAVETARRERTLASLIIRVRRYYATFPPHHLRQWLPLADDLEPILRRGAFLIGAHFGSGLLTTLALSQLRIPIFAIIRASPAATLRPPMVEICDLRKVPGHRAVTGAWATLRRGGVVFMAADGSSGNPAHDVEVQVLRGTRLMSRGFAELALATAVAPTPIYSRVDETGRIHTWAMPALALPVGERAAQIATLTQAFASEVSAMVLRYPGNATPGIMRRCLNERPPRS